MARAGRKMLDTGDIFPSMEFITTDGGKIELPDDARGKWTVLLFYRGHF